jgi:hypothetical protein
MQSAFFSGRAVLVARPPCRCLAAWKPQSSQFFPRRLSRRALMRRFFAPQRAKTLDAAV